MKTQGKEKKTDLVLFAGTDELILKAKNELVTKTIGSEEQLKAIVDTYENLTIAGIQDMASYKVVEQGAKDIKKLRGLIDKHRKELTAPALKWQKDLIAEADRIINIVHPIEKSLLEKKTKIDDAKKAAEQELFTARCAELATKGYQLNGKFYMCGALQINSDDISKLNDEEYSFFINEGQKELDRKQAEKDRKAAESKELNDRLTALEEREAKLAAREAALDIKEGEVATQTEALEKTYANLETPPEEIKQTVNDEGIVLDSTVEGLNSTDDPVKLEPTGGVAFDNSKEPAKEQTKAFDTTEAHAVPPSKAFTKPSPEYQVGFNDGTTVGFNDMKNRVVQLLSGENKMKRSEIVKFCKEQKFK